MRRDSQACISISGMSASIEHLHMARALPTKKASSSSPSAPRTCLPWRRFAGGFPPHGEALHIDLADLRGYHYHNGAIFSVFTPGEPSAIGNGGRYDGIGKAFGRSRPATGFTLDLRQLASVV